MSECVSTESEEYCLALESEYCYCKFVKAMQLCPPAVTSESETYSESS
jgi:hypothetical protein